MDKHNTKFAVEPKDDTSAYRVLEEDVDLTYVFAVREQRQIGSGQTLSYGGQLYTLATQKNLFEPRTLVEVRETMHGEVVIFHQGRALPLRETQKPHKQPRPQKTKKASSTPPRKPAKDHPWKNQGKTRENKFSIAQIDAVSKRRCIRNTIATLSYPGNEPSKTHVDGFTGRGRK